MLQTAVGKMNLVIHLIILVWVSKHAEGRPTTQCKSISEAGENLKVAEELIQMARKKLPTNCQLQLPTDCEEILQSGERRSGVYVVWPKNRVISGYISVYCDMDTDGGGWTVIQRRGNYSRPKDYFNQDWEIYKEGFGNLKEDFWLGNDKIYALSNQKLYSVRFDLGDVEGNKAFATYNTFRIEEESSNYTLHFAGYGGNAGNSLSVHNGQKFSTKDRDNDQSDGHCAADYKGGWWYRRCYAVNLNGEYNPGKLGKNEEGIIWSGWKGLTESLATTEIKIKRNRSWVK